MNDGNPDALRAQSHRAEAKRLREVAARARSSINRESFEALAQEYDQLADAIEHRLKRCGIHN